MNALFLENAVRRFSCSWPLSERVARRAVQRVGLQQIGCDMSVSTSLHPDVPGFTPRTLETERELGEDRRPLHRRDVGNLLVEVRPGADTLWIIVRRAGHGAVAFKTARNAGPVTITGRATKAGGSWRATGASGVFTVRLDILSDTLLRLKVSLTPAADLLVPFWSRDIYPLDAHDRPTHVVGRVEAAQRGLNTGLCYFCVEKPAFGSVLYLQDLTSLNDYFAATKTKPDGVVGGEWPELGYQPPTAPMGNSPPVEPLKAGIEVTISDALIAFRPACEDGERNSAAQFVEMLGEIYPHLTRPPAEYHDWLGRSKRTLRDLLKMPESVIEHYGHKYLHPYVEAEYPDSMVQMSVATSITEYGRALGKAQPVADDLLSGMGRFYDKELKSIRRYLPNVGDDKDADAVDSWYLYHPMMNLGRLALWGDAKAEKLFMESLEFAIKAAHHFKYVWPIQYNVKDFSVITPSRNAQGLGQTDVGGIYAYVMLQAHELTGEDRFLREARNALRALRDVRFELVYQTNLTAWGLAACARLWKLDEDEDAFTQSLVFLAGFFHNCQMWDSQIEHARHYTNFLGVTCLHDAPYLAAYECFEAFAAFDEYLELGGNMLPPHVRMLCAEFRKYSLDRGWYFYPDALPEDAIAKDNIRNGHIDRKLSFPLEDLYGDGRQAGEVGQEIYGCGGAFVFVARAYRHIENAPFLIFTDYPCVAALADSGTITVHLHGPPGFMGRVKLVGRGRRKLPRIRVRHVEETIVASRRDASFRDYQVPADAPLTITWTSQA